MTRRTRDAIVMIVASLAAFVATASPAGAQQLVDAGKENGGGATAFVLFAALVGVTFAVLFSMDRVRRRRQEAEEREQQR
jgi:Na+/melibiose symporter-like transporter